MQTTEPGPLDGRSLKVWGYCFRGLSVVAGISALLAPATWQILVGVLAMVLCWCASAFIIYRP